MVEKVIKNNNLEGAPDLAKRLHNCDEAGLSTNPVSKKVFIPKREKNAYLKAPGAGKASYSVLFCVSADGDLCPFCCVQKSHTKHENLPQLNVKRERLPQEIRKEQGHWLSEEMGARTKFFQMLEKLLDDLGIKDMPERIYNLDETGLSLDPKKSKAFSHRGSKNVQYVVPSEEKAM
eukprot:gene20961-23011_t